PQADREGIERVPDLLREDQPRGRSDMPAAEVGEAETGREPFPARGRNAKAVSPGRRCLRLREHLAEVARRLRLARPFVSDRHLSATFEPEAVLVLVEIETGEPGVGRAVVRFHTGENLGMKRS